MTHLIVESRRRNNIATNIQMRETSQKFAVNYIHPLIFDKFCRNLILLIIVGLRFMTVSLNAIGSDFHI